MPMLVMCLLCKKNPKTLQKPQDGVMYANFAKISNMINCVKVLCLPFSGSSMDCDR